jgi:hypothetical protein
MLVHQKRVVLATRLISLGFIRGVVMEMKGDKKNWVMYTEWTNQEQQR